MQTDTVTINRPLLLFNRQNTAVLSEKHLKTVLQISRTCLVAAAALLAYMAVSDSITAETLPARLTLLTLSATPAILLEYRLHHSAVQSTHTHNTPAKQIYIPDLMQLTFVLNLAHMLITRAL